MISLCKMEWYKLWHRKSFLTLLAFLFIFNLAYLGYTQFINNKIAPSYYQRVEQKLSSLPNDERYDYIKNYRERLQAYEVISQIKQLQADSSEPNTKQLAFLRSQYPGIEQRYPNGDKKVDLQFSNQYDVEVQLVDMYYQEMKTLYEYPSFLDEIQERATSLQQISIFQTEDSYVQENIKKTAHDFKKLGKSTIVYTSEKGIVEALSPLTSVLLLIVLLAISTYLIMEEKERNLFSIIQATPLGNFKTILSKLSVMSFSILIISCVFFLINLSMMHMLYGLGDLSRSLQSLSSYSKCALNIDVKTFLCLFLGLKWITLWCLGAIIVTISLLFKNRNTSIAIILFLLIVGYLCTKFINPNGELRALYYCNFFTLLQSETLLKQYVNFNIFNNPMSLGLLSTIAITFCSIVMGSCCCVVYIKKLALWEFVIPSFTKKHRYALTLWKQEAYKFLWLQKVVFIFLLFLGIQGFQASQSKLYLDRDEKFYIQYLNNLEGPYTKEKENFLEKEHQRFESLHQQLEIIQKRYEKGLLDKIKMERMRSSIESQLSSEPTFQEVLEYAEYVKANPSREFVMEFTHVQLLQSRTYLLNPAILLLIVLTFVLSNLFTFDYQHDVQSLLACTSNGKKRLFKIKIKEIFLTVCVFYVIAYFPSILEVMKAYGISSWTASITSIPSFVNAPASIAIWHMYVLTHALRILAFFCYGCILSYFAVKGKQQLLAIFLGLLLFFIPLLLNYFDLPIVNMISLYPMILPLSLTSLVPLLVCSLGYGMLCIGSLFVIYKHHLT
ncbi:MAG: ABC transporter permease subunit [Longicatena sp.]